MSEKKQAYEAIHVRLLSEQYEWLRQYSYENRVPQAEVIREALELFKKEKEGEQVYYVIETTYVGPNREQHWDADTIVISKTPALTNMSHEEITEGWAGTTNDWSVHAHGAYATIEEAEAAVREKFGGVRGEDIHGYTFEDGDPDKVAIYKPGEFAPLSGDEAGEWVEQWKPEIAAATTDEDIEETAEDMEQEARAQGLTFELVRDFLVQLLENKREEAAEDE
jgi:hypothetical protein